MDKLVQGQPIGKYKDGIDDAIKIMKQNLGLWQYHAVKTSVIRIQADRISQIFQDLGKTNPSSR